MAGSASSATTVMSATSSTTRSWSSRQTPRLRARGPPTDEPPPRLAAADRFLSDGESFKLDALFPSVNYLTLPDPFLNDAGERADGLSIWETVGLPRGDPGRGVNMILAQLSDPHIVAAGKLFRCPIQGTAPDAERAWLEFDTAPYLARADAAPIFLEEPWRCRNSHSHSGCDLHARFTMHRINHQEAYSLGDGIHSNNAESFFSRMRRAEIGHHHHLAGPYLIRFAQEASWREDHRKEPNGSQVDRVVALAMRNKPSVDFCGYWQRARVA
jgi:hypothetical protein